MVRVPRALGGDRGRGHHAAVMLPFSFGEKRPFEWASSRTLAVRYPRPSVLARRLAVDGPKAEQAAEALGLLSVGDLLWHLPRDRREARAVAELTAGETATVVVQVRGISSRSVRRRGMRPLVEATVADDTGAMKATFFNQPWLVGRYPAGTRLVLHGKFEARNRFGVQAHAQTSEGDSAAATRSRLYRHGRPVLDRDPRARPPPRGAIDDVLEPLPAGLRVRERRS